MLMDDFQHHSAAGCLQISKLTSVEGEATVWVVRGSKRQATEANYQAQSWLWGNQAAGCKSKGSLTRLAWIVSSDA